MDSIVQIRQMMAEQKFFEAQRSIEVQLKLNHEARHELLLLYAESLQNQQKDLSPDLAIELAEHEAREKKFESALQFIPSQAIEVYFTRILKIKIAAMEEKGQMLELYHHLSDFLLRQFEKQVPSIPSWINELIEKYFREDFNLKLKRLALSLLLNDVTTSEALVKELIVSTFEHSSPKGVAEKLLSIGEVLKAGSNKAQLEIYQNFCFIHSQGIQEKTDYKRLVEMVIHFNEFRFQVMLLNLLYKLDLSEETEMYSKAVRQNADYNYVYLDKYFSHLKKYFFKETKVSAPVESYEIPDLELSEKVRHEIVSSYDEVEATDEEQNFYHLLKYQTFTLDQLCDLAVSFLQSDMPGVALKAAQKAIDASTEAKGFLKASYLKLTAQLKLKDYRAAIDTCFIALDKAESQDDILSFMYGQAEAYIRLNQRKQARSVLAKILSIDAKYRLAKERFDQLNEI